MGQRKLRICLYKRCVCVGADWIEVITYLLNSELGRSFSRSCDSPHWGILWCHLIHSALFVQTVCMRGSRLDQGYYLPFDSKNMQVFFQKLRFTPVGCFVEQPDTLWRRLYKHG